MKVWKLQAPKDIKISRILQKMYIQIKVLYNLRIKYSTFAYVENILHLPTLTTHI